MVSGTGALRVLLLALPLCTTPALADIYRWVDDSGKVHYGDRFLPGGTEALDLPAAPPMDPHLAERRRKQQRLLEAIAQERREEKESQEQVRQQQADRRLNCAQARDQLRMVDRQGRIFELDAEGRRRYWDDRTREQQRARIARYLDEHCD